MSKHHERAHSKFSASGFERIASCPGSVELCEGLPDKSNPAAERGTKAHEVLEVVLTYARDNGGLNDLSPSKSLINLIDQTVDNYELCMVEDACDASNFIVSRYRRVIGAKRLMVESRVYLDFIHPEAFGTLDSSILEFFGTLDVFDYKYGKHLVSPKGNWQFLFYALAIAYKYKFNFHSVRMWTIQPNTRNADGHSFWMIPISELMVYIPKFEQAVERVEKFPKKYAEGDWCFFCKGKNICPLKRKKRLDVFD
jgi:hypothetical protein